MIIIIEIRDLVDFLGVPRFFHKVLRKGMLYKIAQRKLVK